LSQLIATQEAMPLRAKVHGDNPEESLPFAN
jgi:hypothetical protein